jgi:fructose/tagatose bisphosphate aldolase
MPLERTSTILKDGEKNGYGVAAFNIFNYETIAWAIQAAEEERIPVIIQFYPGFDRYMPMEVVTAVTKELAAKASIPVGLHLDHSNGSLSNKYSHGEEKLLCRRQGKRGNSFALVNYRKCCQEQTAVCSAGTDIFENRLCPYHNGEEL